MEVPRSKQLLCQESDRATTLGWHTRVRKDSQRENELCLRQCETALRNIEGIRLMIVTRRTLIRNVSAGFVSSISGFAKSLQVLSASRTIDVTSHGAVGDGETINTRSIQTAINACAAAGGGMVAVPAGIFVTAARDVGKAHDLTRVLQDERAGRGCGLSDDL